MAEHDEVCVLTQYTSDRDSFALSIAHATPSAFQDGLVSVMQLAPTGMWRRSLSWMARFYGRPRAINPLFAQASMIALEPHLRRVAQDFRADVVHAMHIGLVYSSEIAMAAAHHLRIPFVWTPFPHIEGDGWTGPRFRRLYRMADAIITMTEFERDWVIKQGSVAERVHVAQPGPLVPLHGNGEAFRAQLGLGTHPVVLFVGQKLPYKGYRAMVDAAPSVWTRYPDVRFVFVGPRTPESESFFRTISDPRVLELPMVDDAQKANGYAACDIFCMPSTQESFGMVYLEAWSYGKPVIAAQLGVTEEIVEHGIDGLLTQQKPEAIAGAIIALLDNPALRSTIGRAGQAKVATKYNWAHSVTRLKSAYTALVNLAQEQTRI
jgi:glycosyltransferase involved in cell wall biosynthesis